MTSTSAAAAMGCTTLLAIVIGGLIICREHLAESRELLADKPNPATWTAEVYEVPGLGPVCYWRSPDGRRVLTEQEMTQLRREVSAQ